MNTDTTASHYSLERQLSHGYTSSGSESRRLGGGSSKKRASRAGTRSVNTLSVAQLERKRANDREAQRAIRQRTKDHIENLEKNVGELRESKESNDKLVAVTTQRNRELEEENAYLRSRLSEAGYPLPQAEPHRPSDAPLVPVQTHSPVHQASVSGSSLHGPSTSSPASLSLATSHSSNSRHSSFHQQFLPPVPSSAVTMAQSSLTPNSQSVTGWRPHDAGQALQSERPSTMHASVQHHTPTTFPSSGTPTTQQQLDWASSAQSYQYSGQEQPPLKYAPPPPPPPSASQHGYVQTSVPGYASTPVAHPQGYHPPQMPPQAEFQNMAVSSPGPYQMSQQAAAAQQQNCPTSRPQGYHNYQSAYQMASVPMPTSSATYSSSQGQIPGMATPSYHQPPEQQYATQAPASSQTQLPYRDDAASRGYTLSHYPSA